jgi:hypothetical protein
VERCTVEIEFALVMISGSGERAKLRTSPASRIVFGLRDGFARMIPSPERGTGTSRSRRGPRRSRYSR